MIALPDRLQAERKRCGLTLREVGRLAPVSASHLSRIEHGREPPSASLLMRLGAVYGVPGEELVLHSGRIPEAYIPVVTGDPARALRVLRYLVERPAQEVDARAV